MSDRQIRLRVLLGLYPGDRFPMVVGACDETTWEVIPDEDWQAMVRRWKESILGPDWQTYDYAEAVIDLPTADLVALFQTKTIQGSVSSSVLEGGESG